MGSDDEECCSENIVFVKRPLKSGGRLPRPRSSSIPSQIISNPKLVKSLQNLEIGPRHGLIRPVSCVNIRGEQGKCSQFQEEFGSQLRESKTGLCHKYWGILLGLFASFVFSLSSILVKSISQEYHPYTLSFWTLQGIFLPSLAILLFQKLRKETVCQGIFPCGIKRNFWNFVLVVSRALFGAGGTVLKVYSLKYMSVADSTVITFSSPVFVVIVAWIFLDEKCGVLPIFTSIAVLVGVGIITRPPWITGNKEFNTELLIGCAMAFSCMLLGVFTVVILRYIRDVHYALITFIYGLIGTVGTLALCWWEDSLEAPKTMEHWFYAVGIAGLTFLGQNSLTLALQFEQAGPISLIRPSEIVFTIILQFMLLKQVPDWFGFLGATIVLIGVLVITARKWLTTLEESHQLKKSCALLLL